MDKIRPAVDYTDYDDYARQMIAISEFNQRQAIRRHNMRMLGAKGYKR